MGIHKHALEAMIQDFNSRGKKPSGRLLTLSRHAVGFDTQYFNKVMCWHGWNNSLDYDALHISDGRLFSTLGFESLETMDNSDYECADIMYDLNSSDVPAELLGKYDYILDGGTLEHVFHLPNALEAIFKMLKVGGTFFFDQPAFFGLNHGFYNISPCFYYEYFSVNKWKINSFRLFSKIEPDLPFYDMNVSEQDLRTRTIDIKGESPLCLMWGSVTKTSESICTATPTQPIYQDEWERVKNDNINKVFDIIHGERVFLYGTGGYAARLLMQLRPDNRKRLETGGMLSRSPDEIGKYFMDDIKIYDISAVNRTDTIIIASTDYTDVIYERIKYLEKEGVKIVKLF